MNYAFHRLERSWPKYRWFRPILTGLIGGGIFLLLSVGVSFVFIAIALSDQQGTGAAFLHFVETQNLGDLDNSDPLTLALTLASVSVMLPSIIAARAIMGPRPLGLISSVEGRLRWGWMLRLLVPACIAFGAAIVVNLVVIPVVFGEQLVPPTVTQSTWLLALIPLLLVPLQATAEEYVFRGYLLQMVGSWVKHPALTVILSTALFALAHPQYDLWGMLDVGVFGLFAAWITLRTGGLEAAIVAHVINNTWIFVAGAFGLIDVNASEGSLVGVLGTTLTLGLFGWLVVRITDRRGVFRERFVPQPTAPAPDDGPFVDSKL